MSKVVSGRVPDELADWLDAYAKERGVTRASVLASAIVALRGDAAGGVPEVKTAVESATSVPMDPTAARRRAQAAAEVYGVSTAADLLADRQRALNKKIGWS
jgi:hypothetical protein